MRFRPAVPAAVLALVLATSAARATPNEYLPVDDPLNAELRVLETLSPLAATGRPARIAFGTRPLLRREAMTGLPVLDSLDVVRRISAVRLARGLERDVVVRAGRGTWSTPRLFERGDARDGRFELSAGLEGEGDVARHADPSFATRSGLQLRATLALDRWTFHTHTLVGQVDGARAWADPIVPNSDLVVHTEETYAAYAAERWSAQFGRSRWAWGPGEEGSLQLSASGPALTGLALSADLPALHLRAITLSATLAGAAGEQLAAHRLEWRPTDALALGATETARYRSSGWQPLYALGLIPYTLVQRMLVQDEPDSSGALRNNVMVGADVAWRVADGTRVYGEVLVDDLHAKTGDVPNKVGYQLGWDGAGAIGGSRVTWNGEFTRLSHYVYTSSFGRSFVSDGLPLGYFTGPDARRVRVRVSWDPDADWQVFARAARTDRGQGTLEQPFVPGVSAPAGSTFAFQGTVERTREADLGVRWWPASGVDLTLSAGWTWVDDAVHVPGVKDDAPHAALQVRLTR